MSKSASRKHYLKFYVKRRAEIVARRNSSINFVRGFKAVSWCRCGETESCCLDFHHKNPEDKSHLVSVMPRRGFSIRNILTEIEKCEILCANCHRKQHYGAVI